MRGAGAGLAALRVASPGRGVVTVLPRAWRVSARCPLGEVWVTLGVSRGAGRCGVS